MKYNRHTSRQDKALVDRYLIDFIPEEIYDIHTHPYDERHFPPQTLPFLADEQQLGVKAHVQKLHSYMPVKKFTGSILACHIKRPT